MDQGDDNEFVRDADEGNRGGFGRDADQGNRGGFGRGGNRGSFGRGRGGFGRGNDQGNDGKFKTGEEQDYTKSGFGRGNFGGDRGGSSGGRGQSSERGGSSVGRGQPSERGGFSGGRGQPSERGGSSGGRGQPSERGTFGRGNRGGFGRGQNQDNEHGGAQLGRGRGNLDKSKELATVDKTKVDVKRKSIECLELSPAKKKKEEEKIDVLPFIQAHIEEHCTVNEDARKIAEEALKKMMQPAYCVLCNARMSGSPQAMMHYQGKNHNKKIKNFITCGMSKYVEKVKEDANKTEEQIAKEKAEEEERNRILDQKVAEVCKKFCIVLAVWKYEGWVNINFQPYDINV
jgi:hypothetical protein